MATIIITVNHDLLVNREIFGDAGVYVKVGDIDEFAETLLKLATDNKRMEEMRQKLCKRSLEKFSLSKMAESIMKVYRYVYSNRYKK